MKFKQNSLRSASQGHLALFCYITGAMISSWVFYDIRRMGGSIGGTGGSDPVPLEIRKWLLEKQ